MISGEVTLNLGVLDIRKGQLAARSREIVRSAAEVTEKEISRLVEETAKTGRIYPSRTGSGEHQASAPGESWASDTGELLDKLLLDDAGLGNAIPEVRVGWRGPEAVIAGALEFGRHDGRIAPRPTMQPAVPAAVEAAKAEEVFPK